MFTVSMGFRVLDAFENRIYWRRLRVFVYLTYDDRAQSRYTMIAATLHVRRQNAGTAYSTIFSSEKNDIFCITLSSHQW